MFRPSARPFVAAAIAAALLAVVPAVRPLEAQDDKVYALAEVEAAPKLANAAAAGKAIQESYPSSLRDRGIGGMVELEFVVDEEGKVDASSVQVLSTTQTQLGGAAKKVATRLAFTPGKAGGKAVRTKVVLPIVYKP